MIIIPLIAGIFLRVFQIWNNYYFPGEGGRELLYVWQLTGSHKFPLIGLTTSHEWLSYGPIYYWILMPVTKIFGWSPYILFWLALIISTIGIFVTYKVFEKIVNKNFALILSFFISLSPLWIWATRLSKLHTFFFILSPLIIYYLYKIWQGKNKFTFWLGVVFGALFSFHFSQIPILGVIILAFWIKRKSLRLKNYAMFVLGLIIPNISVLLHDAQNGFSMTKNLILWIPYRIAGFAGVAPKNNLTFGFGKNTFSSFNEFFGQNLFTDSRFWVIGSLIFLVLFTVFLVGNRKKFTKDFLSFYIISSTSIQCISLMIHTAPPLHYFFPIFLNFGILFAYFAYKYWQKRSTKILTVVIYFLMIPMVLVSFGKEHDADLDFVPVIVQEDVVNKIVEDASGRPFSLRRVGPYDYFPENYAQNYQFLALKAGGKWDPSADLVYTIYDEEDVYFTKNE